MEFFTSRIFVSILLRFVICSLIIIVFTSPFEHKYNTHFKIIYFKIIILSYVLSCGDSHWFPLLLSRDDIFFPFIYLFYPGYCSAFWKGHCYAFLKSVYLCFNRWLILLKFKMWYMFKNRYVQTLIYSGWQLKFLFSLFSFDQASWTLPRHRQFRN